MSETGKLPKGVPPHMISRTQFAAMLGVKVEEIKRRQRTGILKPDFTDENGWHYYYSHRVEEQRKFSRKRVQLEDEKASYTAGEAATVFDALVKGKSLIDIVRENGIHPLSIESAVRAYQRMNGGLFLSGDALKEIEMLPNISGTFPIEEEDQLLEILRESLGDMPCDACHKRKKALCTVCAKGLARKGEEEI